LAKIQEKWPESARDAQKITQSPFKRNPNNLIDEFVIELDPDLFFEGLTSIISEDDPVEREFFHRNDVYQIESNLCKNEEFEEEGSNQPWEYQLFADMEIRRSSSYSNGSEKLVTISKSYIGGITLRHLGRGRYHVKFLMDYEIPDLENYMKKLAESTRMSYPTKISKVTPHIASSNRGPTEDTKRKAEVIREIQETYPNWTKLQVALEAGKKLKMEIQIHDVDNVYRAMGLSWTEIRNQALKSTDE